MNIERGCTLLNLATTARLFATAVFMQLRGRLSSMALRTPIAGAPLCTKIRPLSDEWARVGLGANRAAPHEKLNRLLFVQCGFGCDRESLSRNMGVS